MTVTTSAPSAAEKTAIPMTDEQKFLFDLKGWLLIPGVLEPGLIKAIKEHAELWVHHRDKLAPKDRYSYSGPAAELLDHPAIVGVLREIIAADTSPTAYGFRCDNSFYAYRTPGSEGIAPHGGGPRMHPNFSYQCKNQRMYSGLTRVVWELTEVEKGAGGTLLLSGSHKSNFHVPAEHLRQDSWVYETYACPPGSVLLFSENLAHSGAKWNSNHPRIALFNAYIDIQCRYHRSVWDFDAIAAMPAKRQTLFRGVWGDAFHTGAPTPNDWYGPDNQA